MSHKTVLTKRLRQVGRDKTSKAVQTKRLPDKMSKSVLTKHNPDKTSILTKHLLTFFDLLELVTDFTLFVKTGQLGPHCSLDICSLGLPTVTLTARREVENTPNCVLALTIQSRYAAHRAAYDLV